MERIDNLDAKKKQEFFYLEKVLELKRIKVSKIFPGDPLDFKIIADNKTIGVEVTEYYKDISKKGSISREIEEYENLIEEKLNDAVSKLDHLKEIDVLFTYREDDLRPAKNEIKSFIDEMIEFVSQSIVYEWEESKELKPTDKFTILRKYISWLLVFRKHFYPYWRQFQGGCTTLKEDILMKVIEPKLHKAKKYKTHNDIEDLWLIIGVGHLPSQITPPPNFVEMYLKNFNKLEAMLKNSLFDKVYFYLSFEHLAFEWPGWKKITKEKYFKLKII